MLFLIIITGASLKPAILTIIIGTCLQCSYFSKDSSGLQNVSRRQNVCQFRCGAIPNSYDVFLCICRGCHWRLLELRRFLCIDRVIGRPQLQGFWCVHTDAYVGNVHWRLVVTAGFLEQKNMPNLNKNTSGLLVSRIKFKIRPI